MPDAYREALVEPNGNALSEPEPITMAVSDRSASSAAPPAPPPDRGKGRRIQPNVMQLQLSRVSAIKHFGAWSTLPHELRLAARHGLPAPGNAQRPRRNEHRKKQVVTSYELLSQEARQLGPVKTMTVKSGLVKRGRR